MQHRELHAKKKSGLLCANERVIFRILIVHNTDYQQHLETENNCNAANSFLGCFASNNSNPSNTSTSTSHTSTSTSSILHNAKTSLVKLFYWKFICLQFVLFGLLFNLLLSAFTCEFPLVFRIFSFLIYSMHLLLCAARTFFFSRSPLFLNIVASNTISILFAYTWICLATQAPTE